MQSAEGREFNSRLEYASNFFAFRVSSTLCLKLNAQISLKSDIEILGQFFAELCSVTRLKEHCKVRQHELCCTANLHFAAITWRVYCRDNSKSDHRTLSTVEW
jgi:hypothetical protein